MSSLLEVRNVNKIYKSEGESLEVLQEISFDLKKGESLIITGESGCGKSTLLNIIGGLDSVTSGSINSCGLNITDMGEEKLTSYRKKSVGFIFQFHYLLKDFSALENLMLPLLINGESKKIAKEHALKLINDVGLYDRKKHYPSQLSGGERQRVAIARALANRPKIILADEPTGNLDEMNSGLIQNLLFKLVEDYNKSLILVTHDATIKSKGNFHYSIKSGRFVNQ
ncbi:ABC transporter ATP-binding protein [Thiospirochaeta perfilievii]|uniref:ABC transporter ATP-binding protein n=1 Tax=Thiospirochaeta perfilievii TaxID=252967 RepID=A0A5C1Q8H4_9SPIO|nr:ABC transporter ATP-binding protein [Thiospirochaeta perfilievii]QEN03791.1 ABC transporter ATP-binding protein [Thiospirochaeta perfilievii]